MSVSRSVAAVLALLAWPWFTAVAALPRPPEPGRVPVASVRIRSPSPSDVVNGLVTIAVEVIPLGDRKILRVDIFADGVLVAGDPLPPFQTPWQAGRGLQSRVIRAVALFDDGSRAEELITTRGLRFTEEVLVEATPIEHVELLISVIDGAGLPVGGLTSADVEIREEGEPVQMTAFRPLSERVDLPLSLVMLVDRSGSMRVHMEKIARAATELISVIRPMDQVRVAAFSDEMAVLQDFTRDPLSLLESLDDVGPPVGGTRLFEALYHTVWDMRDRPGRKVIVVLTDGLDSDYTSPSSPITTTMSAFLRQVVRDAVRAGVTVIVILPGPSGRGYLAVQDLALQTGGWYAYPGEDFAEMIRMLGERLLGAYVAEYDVARPDDLDRKRPVEVELSEGHPKQWKVRAAMGAYAGLNLLDVLVEDLERGTPVQRARAARDLAFYPGGEVVKKLARVLRDSVPEVRVAAIESLSRRGDAEAMEKVLKRIHDSDEAVRRAAFEGAVRYGASAVPWLVAKAGGRGDSRLESLKALGSIGDQRAGPILLESLEHSRCSVRAAAAVGSGRIVATMVSGRDSSAYDELVRGLQALLSDTCREASGAARAALEKLSLPESSTGR